MRTWYQDALLFIAIVLLILTAVIIGGAKFEARAQEDMVTARPAYEIRYEYVEKPVVYENEKHEILAYIVKKFGDDSADAITLVRKCENSTFDQSRTNHNRNGSVDYGVFQINDIHVKRYGEAFKTDWRANVDTAYEIFKAQGWSPWACSQTIGVKSFWE